MRIPIIGKKLESLITTQEELDELKTELISYTESRLKSLFSLNGLKYQALSNCMSPEELEILNRVESRINELDDYNINPIEEEDGTISDSSSMAQGIAHVFRKNEEE